MNTNKKYFRFKLGRFDCMVVTDGTCKMPDKKREQMSEKDEFRDIELDVLSLLVKTEKHTVLMDTGWGVGMEPGAGELIQNLRAAGVPCTEIDRVIHSHGHPDHIGGNTDTEGKPAFPNARHIIHQKEWQFWTAPPELIPIDERIKPTVLAAVQKNLIPLKDRISLVDEEAEIVPGISFIKAPGHSPGQIALIISSGTEQLICTCDVFHHTSELSRIGWSLTSGNITEEALNTRTRILSLAVKTNALVFISHFPFPGLGHIGKSGDTWLWQPLK